LLLPTRLIVPLLESPPVFTVEAALRLLFPIFRLLLLLSVPPMLSVLPDELASTVTVPLLPRFPVTDSVPPGSAICNVATDVLSVIDATEIGVVSWTVPKGMTAASPAPGTAPVLQAAAVVQFAVPSIQVTVAKFFNP